MKQHTLLTIICIVLTLGFVANAHSTSKNLDDFSTSRIAKFPKRWRTWPFQRSKAAKVYKIAKENDEKFIRAYDDHNASQQIFLNMHWPVKKHPKLHWKWRATTIPKGAHEDDGNTNDSACGIYIVVGKYSGHAIKYVWSSTLPTNTVVSRRDGKLKIKVLNSGNTQHNKWVKHTVDVVMDYKELFGKSLHKNPSGIGLLTDGNALNTPAGCDYKDFSISSN